MGNNNDPIGNRINILNLAGYTVCETSGRKSNHKRIIPSFNKQAA